jgi:phage gpG-like protein
MANNPLSQLGKDADRIDRFLRTMPRAMGQIAVREFVGMFRRQAFVDEAGTSHAWPERKRKSKKAGRAILVKSGRLRRSIRVMSRDGDSVTIGTDVPYAQIHNEGGTLNATQSIRAHRRRRFSRDEVSGPSAKREKWVKTLIGTSDVKGHTRQLNTQMPQRQFMGASQPVTQEIRATIDAGLKNLLG